MSTVDVFSALRCKICNDNLDDPHKFECCKTTCCKTCILAVDDKSKCPFCGQSQFKYYPDEDTKKILAKNFPFVRREKNDNWLEGPPEAQVQCIYCRDEIHSRKKLKDRVETPFLPSKLEDVFQITKSASDKWNQIGCALGLDEATIEGIKSQCERDGVERCYCKLIEKWIKSTRNANWCKLIGAFRHHSVKLEELAKDVEKSKMITKPFSCSIAFIYFMQTVYRYSLR